MGWLADCVPMSSYNLRPHHGLCIQFFRGEGYSAEFVANMTEIVAKLGGNPQVHLVSGADDLCRTCPNRVGERDCKSDEKVLRYDEAVLRLCGLSQGDVLPWKEFAARVEREIFSKNLRTQICGQCQWNHLCQ